MGYNIELLESSFWTPWNKIDEAFKATKELLNRKDLQYCFR